MDFSIRRTRSEEEARKSPAIKKERIVYQNIKYHLFILGGVMPFWIQIHRPNRIYNYNIKPQFLIFSET
jgi:hypothetical protein